MEASVLFISLLSLFLLADCTELTFQETMLLRALGLNRRPQPASPRPVPHSLWAIFEKGINADNPCRMESFQVPGNIVRSYSDQGPFISNEESHDSLCVRKHLFFDLSVIEEKEEVTFGQLEIKFKHNTYHGHGFQLRIYRPLHMTLKAMRNHHTNRKLLFAHSFRLLHKSLHFNLTKVTQDWTNLENNMGLILEISADGEDTDIQKFSSCHQMPSFIHTSLLTVSLDPTNCKASRTKRNAEPSPPTPSNICSKRRLYIDFKDVGWQNWVIAPRGYMANYCHGECPYPLTEMLKGTNHAVLQTLVHSIEPETTPLPCCAPTKLSPISMLYYDNNDNVVLRHYEDMVVDECGCK
ncbi:growth/differentiation factor 3-like [Hyperolius riggenbachi]|uniref:growth/differentiation factor 3-like n=1 Tax=Hyperolius riggenbachi TaxID=752182 RepID=UPI0035A334EC